MKQPREWIFLEPTVRLKYFPFSRSVVAKKKKNNRFFQKFSPQQKMSRLIFIVRYNATSTSPPLFRFFLSIPKKISKILSKSFPR